jgi:hypothetical protein
MDTRALPSVTESYPRETRETLGLTRHGSARLRQARCDASFVAGVACRLSGANPATECDRGRREYPLGVSETFWRSVPRTTAVAPCVRADPRFEIFGAEKTDE